MLDKYTPYGYNKYTRTGYSEGEMDHCKGCEMRYKGTPRSEEQIKQLVSRLNRISGQLSGIKKMVEENRYCGEVLVQVSAVESAVRAFGYLVLEDHLATCVSERIRAGDADVVRETVELVKKLN